MSNTVGSGSRATISTFNQPRIWRDFSRMFVWAVVAGVSASAVMMGIVLTLSRG
jgi:hypothetical protein